MILPREYQGMRTLEELCDYGANRQHGDARIIPRFELGHIGEVELVKAYMSEKHPTVRFQITLPHRDLGGFGPAA